MRIVLLFIESVSSGSQMYRILKVKLQQIEAEIAKKINIKVFKNGNRKDLYCRR